MFPRSKIQASIERQIYTRISFVLFSKNSPLQMLIFTRKVSADCLKELNTRVFQKDFSELRNVKSAVILMSNKLLDYE